MNPSRIQEVAAEAVADVRRNGTLRHLAPDGPVEPLFDPRASAFGRFMGTEPKPRVWVGENWLPLGVSAGLAGMGGVGKSMALLQLGCSVATGIPYLGLPMGEPGAFLLLGGEDDDGEYHRRGFTVVEHYVDLGRASGMEPTEVREMIAERLHVVSRVGEDNLLTHTAGDGSVYPTLLVERLNQSAVQIEDLRTVALDPASRFKGGKENANEDNTRYVEVCEAIAKATGATVLSTHHVNKASIREGGGEQDIVRGGTAFVDGVRWLATLQRLRRDAAKDYGLHEDEASRYLRFDIPKSNYTPPFPGMWLRREAGGILVPTELEPTGASSQVEKAQAEYVAIVGRLQALLKDTGPLTRYSLRKHSGLAGSLKAGDQTVRSVVERAVRDGDLVDQGGKLYPPEVDL